MRPAKKLFALFLIFAFIASAVPVKANTNDPWASVYSNWLYRREITITNNNAYDLTDFQVKITLDSTNFDSWNKVNADGSDIRFADQSGNPLNYYIEKWDYTNQQAVIWVKVPSIPSSTSVTIYMYYGNSRSTSESNGDEVFEFFDDAENGISSSYTQYGTFDTVYNDARKGYAFHLASTGSWGVVERSALLFNVDFGDAVYEAYFRQDIFSGTGSYQVGLVFCVQDSNNYYYALFDGYSDTIKLNKLVGGSWTVLGEVSFTDDGTWHKLKIVRAGNNIKLYVDDNLLIDIADSEFSSGNFGLRAYRLNNQMWDDVRVRKYADQEPTVSVGAEEVNNPVTVTLNFQDDLGNTLNGVDVYIDNTFYGTFNSGDSVIIPAGTHTFLAQKQYYVDAQQTLDVQSDTTLTLTLDRQSYTVYFYAYDVNNQLINNFTVYANNSLLGTFNSGDSALV